MDRRLRLSCILFIVLLAGLGHAANFGSAAKADSSTSVAGYASFTLLLWSSDSNLSVNMKLLSAPPGWAVDFPETVQIGPDMGNEAVFNGENYVRASTVKVTVNNAFDQGSIILQASTSPGPGLVFIQERIFNLTVRVQGQEAQGMQQPAQQEKGQEGSFPVVYVIIAAIIFISFLIYKFS